MNIIGTNRSQSMGVVTFTKEPENNASRNKKSDRTRAFSGKSFK